LCDVAALLGRKQAKTLCTVYHNPTLRLFLRSLTVIISKASGAKRGAVQEGQQMEGIERAQPVEVLNNRQLEAFYSFDCSFMAIRSLRHASLNFPHLISPHHRLLRCWFTFPMEQGQLF